MTDELPDEDEAPVLDPCPSCGESSAAHSPEQDARCCTAHP